MKRLQDQPGSLPKPGSLRVISSKRKAEARPGWHLADDELMAAAVGNRDWLEVSIHRKIREDGSIPLTFDENGLAAIHLAASGGHLSSVQLLIEKYKVDVNLESRSGLRPLHLCVSSKDTDNCHQCLIYLLKHGADPSLADAEGNTSVHRSASEGNVQCLKELIRAGASVLSINKKGQKPIHLAKVHGHRAAANMLRDGEWYEKSKEAFQEARHQEKLKMQRALSEIMKCSQLNDLRNKYNDQAFGEWLKKHGLSDVPKTLLHIHRKSSSGHLRPSTSTNTKTNKAKALLSHKNIISSGQKNVNKCRIPRESTKDELCENNVELHEKSLDISYWKPSTKVPVVQYIANLKDHYPRDPYTSLPYFFPRRHDDSPSVLLAKTDLEKNNNLLHSELEDLTYTELKSLADALKISNSPTKRFLFRCKSITDVERRRHYDPDSLPKPEIGLHLLNDIHSQLFQCGLFSGKAMLVSREVES